jgi:ParB family chromosome partitioning protein
MDNKNKSDKDSKRQLGKGLSALISDSTISMLLSNKSSGDFLENGIPSPDNIIQLSIDNIEPNPNQPRRVIRHDDLKDLSESISKHGVLQPVLVKRGANHKFQIIAGERRWRAAIMAGFAVIPAMIKEADEKMLFEIAIIENIQRENLNPLEEAQSYNRLIQSFNYTQEDLSSRLGKSRSYIANMLRLLKLPEKVMNLIEEEELSTGHAKVIVSSNNPELLAEKIVNKKLNVRQAEEELRREKNKKSNNRAIINKGQSISDIVSAKSLDNDILQIEDMIKSKLKLDAKIIMNDNENFIILKLQDSSDFDKFLNIIDKI